MTGTWGRQTFAAVILLGILVPSYGLYAPPACPPTGYHQYPNDNCELYYACDNGSLLVLACPLGELYDRIFGRCLPAVFVQCALIPLPDIGPNTTTVAPTTAATTPSTTQPTTTTTTTPKTTTTTRPTTTTPKPPVVCPQTGELIAPTGDCVTYYNCTNGKYVIETCPTGQLLDPATLQCEPFYVVSCIPATTTPVPTTTKKTPTTSKPSICPPTGSEIVPTGDCVTYYNCTNGKYTTDNCPPGDLLDPDTAQCVPFYMTHCVPVTTPKPTTPAPAICPPTGVVDIPTGDCFSYYACTNGKYTIQKCSSGNLFDPQTFECVPFYETQCKPKDVDLSGFILPYE